MLLTIKIQGWYILMVTMGTLIKDCYQQKLLRVLQEALLLQASKSEWNFRSCRVEITPQLKLGNKHFQAEVVQWKKAS